jgi:hypothetical protein
LSADGGEKLGRGTTIEKTNGMGISIEEMVIRIRLTKGERFTKMEFFEMTGLYNLTDDQKRLDNYFYELSTILMKCQAIMKIGTRTNHRRSGRSLDLFMATRNFNFTMNIGEWDERMVEEASKLKQKWDEERLNKMKKKDKPEGQN